MSQEENELGPNYPITVYFGDSYTVYTHTQRRSIAKSCFFVLFNFFLIMQLHINLYIRHL